MADDIFNIPTDARPVRNLTPIETLGLWKYIHPNFKRWMPDWAMVRDCAEGSRRIKDKGVEYLPRLSGQTLDDYRLYKKRALFFPITGKTVSSMVGLATARPAMIKHPAEMDPFFKDSVRPYQFVELQAKALCETMLMGRFGMLIDAPITGSSQPYISTYIAENILNWGVTDDGALQWLLLRETVLVQINEFEYTELPRFRICRLTDGVYTVEVRDKDFNPISTTTPLFAGRTIGYIPFVCIGASGVHMDVDRPPMLDIATINVSHYLSSADLEWGRHFTGLPTPVITGVDSSTVLKIGSTTAWVLPQVESKAMYLEFTGQGLQSLEKALQEKIGLMASMSARLVDSNTKGSEAAETVRLRYMSETASLLQIITSNESGFNLIYKWIAEMMGGDPNEMVIEFFRDVMSGRMPAGELKELFGSYLNGIISKEMLVYNLRRGDMLDPNIADEDVVSQIGDPKPIQPAGTPNV
jgi:hypothetical protein